MCSHMKGMVKDADDINAGLQQCHRIAVHYLVMSVC